MKRSVLFAGLVAIAFSTPAVATVIIQDTYTGFANNGIAAHTPDVNLPGHAYLQGNAETEYGLGTNGGTIDPVSAGVALSGSDGTFAISLASAGSYTKPTDFTISAALNLNGMTPGGNDIDTVGQQGYLGGILLGFFQSAATNASLLAERESGYGVLYGDKGDLLLIAPGSPSQVLGKISGVPTTGTHNLSYEVNTTTGNVSNVLFDGSPVSFGVSTNLFTDANTFMAGAYGRDAGPGNVFGFLDNLTITSVTPVPEPGTISLFALSAAALVAVARKCRRAVNV